MRRSGANAHCNPKVGHKTNIRQGHNSPNAENEHGDRTVPNQTQQPDMTRRRTTKDSNKDTDENNEPEDKTIRKRARMASTYKQLLISPTPPLSA